MATATAEFAQPSSASASGTSTEPGWNRPQLTYEDLKRLADDKFWPAVHAFAEKYKENPSQTLLLTTLSLLAFVPLSAFVALLFLFTTLAACILLLVLQVTLVCSSVVIAAALSVLAFSTLAAPGVARFTEDIKTSRSRLFPSAPLQPVPSPIPEGTTGTPAHHGFRRPGSRRRGFILRNITKPHVFFGLSISMIIAAPIVFLLRHVLVSLLEVLLFVILRLILHAFDNIFTLVAVVGYAGYRLGRPSRYMEPSTFVPTYSPSPLAADPTQAGGPSKTDSPSPVIDFTRLTQYRASLVRFITFALKVTINGTLTALGKFDEALLWLLNKVNEDNGDTTASGSRAEEAADVKKGKMKAAGEEDEGYEMLPTASGSGNASSSAFSNEGSSGLAERKGRKVAFEEEY